jgi:PAS domain S-box-containing protein
MNGAVIAGQKLIFCVCRDITHRKQIEKALKDSEEKFAAAFRASPVIIAIGNMRTGKFIDVNDSYIHAFGYTREELIGRPISEIEILMDPDEPQKMMKIMDEKGEIRNEEFTFRTKSGEARQWLCSAEKINIGGDPCNITVAVDITERKQIEKALKESEEKFSKAFRAIPDSISISRLKDGVFVDVNDSFCRSNGYTREEAIGRTAKDIGLWGPSGGRNQILEGLKKNGRLNNVEFEFQKKSGELSTVLLSAEIFNIADEPHSLVIGTDITDRKRMEKTLKESEEKYSVAFRSSPMIVTIIDLESYSYIEVNDSFIDATGYTREELIGRPLTELNLWADPENEERIARIMREKRALEQETLEFRMKSGEIRAWLTSAENINIGGKPCLLSVALDITERQKTEEALRESEEKFSKAFRSSPHGMAISRLRDNVFVDVNDSFCRLRGHTREELIGHTAKELHLWDNPGERKKMIQMIKDHGSISNVELTQKFESGKTETVLFSADIINIGGEPCMISISNDITERKLMEEALRESEEKFSKAFHAIPEAVSITNLESSVFLEVNPGFINLSGYSSEEIIGNTVQELNILAGPEDHQHINKLMAKQGRFKDQEFTFRRKSGELRNVLLSAETIIFGGKPCILTMANDITERKRMEESLADEATRRRILIEQSRDGIVILDQNGAIYEANRRFAEMLGYSPEEITHLHAWDWESKQSREKLLEMVQAVGEAGDHFETQHRRKDGSIYEAEISTNGAIFAGQKLVFCVCRDITQRKQADAQLQQAVNELELSAARLKATNKELESFSYSVSHDLRSPLRSIDGFSQALLEDYSPKLDNTAKDYLNRLRTASQKMGELIDGLLKLSRLSRVDIHEETVDLSSIAYDISTRLKETHPDRKAEFIIDSGLNVTGDPQMLRVMLENLLGNAWKFTQKVPEARIEFGIADNGEKKTYFIRDNGAGFDMSFKDKLFGAFQRLHDTADFPGTGIGLATVQRIINRHGGGAAFFFTLS